MIEFKSKNIDGEIKSWSFENPQALEDVWNSEDADVPANDDPVWDIKIDGEYVELGLTIEETSDVDDCVWFEDFLTYLGIEIW